MTGDFDPATSDIDLLAVLSSDLDDREFGALRVMHHDFVAGHPDWDGRIDVAYLCASALQTFRSRTSPIAVISPGEPFNRQKAGRDWLVNWWTVREQGIALLGPPATELIDPISAQEVRQVLREYAQYWRERLRHERGRPSQSYAILTLCRALYTTRHGEQISKPRAALWAQERFPQWASLIRRSLEWRRDWRDEALDHAASYPEALAFVDFALAALAEEGG